MRLDCDDRPYAVHLDDKTAIRTRTLVIATGAEYRKPLLAELPRFEGVGVYTARRSWKRNFASVKSHRRRRCELRGTGGGVLWPAPRSARTSWFERTGWQTRCRDTSCGASRRTQR
jgi:hypothetical protein